MSESCVANTASCAGLVRLWIPPAEGFSSASTSCLVMGSSTEEKGVPVTRSTLGASAVARDMRSTNMGRTCLPSLCV
jgi:hypothetical protein